MESNQRLLLQIAKTIEKFSTLANRLQPQLAMAEGFLKVGDKANARSAVEAIAQEIPAVQEQDLYAYFNMASRLAVCLSQLNEPKRSRVLLEKLRIQAFKYDNIDIRDWILYEIAIAYGSLGHLDQALQVSYEIEDDFRRTGQLYEDLISQAIDQNRPQLLFPIFNAITTNNEKRHLMEHAAVYYVLSNKPVPQLSFFMELRDPLEAIKAEISIAKQCNCRKFTVASSDFLDKAQRIAILLASPESKVEQLCEIACLRIELGQVEMAQSLQTEIQAVIDNFSINGDPDRAIAKEIMQNQKIVVAFELNKPDGFQDNAHHRTSSYEEPNNSTIPSMLDDLDVWERAMRQLKQPERENHLLTALKEINRQLLTTEERLSSCHITRLIEAYFA